MLISIVVVATIYMSMNLAFIGVVPWQETLQDGTMANKNIAGAFMTRLYGERAAAIFTGLIIWTCLAGLFAMTLGYSRILYAAAKNGDFFAFFSALHPTRRYPWAALALLSALTAFFCFFPLAIVIQGRGHRADCDSIHRPDLRPPCQFGERVRTPLPFRMWLYPLPSLVALIGWMFLAGHQRRISAQLAVGRLRQRAAGLHSSRSICSAS